MPARRFTRDREASITNKIEGERASFEIICKLSEQLQRLGFLPNHAGSMQIGVHHQAEQVPSSEEIDREIERLTLVAERGGSDEAVMQQLNELRQLAGRAKAAEKLQGIEPSTSTDANGERSTGDEA